MKNKIKIWINTHPLEFEDLREDLQASPDAELRADEFVDVQIGVLEETEGTHDTADLKKYVMEFQKQWIAAADEWFELEYKYQDDTDLDSESRLVYHFVRKMLTDKDSKDVFNISQTEMRKLCETYGFDYASLGEKNDTDSELCETYKLRITLETPFLNKNFWRIEILELVETDE